VATPIAVVGTGFSDDGIINIITPADRALGNLGYNCTVTFTDGENLSFDTNASAPAGTDYVVEYTDPRGVSAVAATPLVLT
jgi:hypothetical protein